MRLLIDQLTTQRESGARGLRETQLNKLVQHRCNTCKRTAQHTNSTKGAILACRRCALSRRILAATADKRSRTRDSCPAAIVRSFSAGVHNESRRCKGLACEQRAESNPLDDRRCFDSKSLLWLGTWEEARDTYRSLDRHGIHSAACSTETPFPCELSCQSPPEAVFVF